ncbi:MAG: insulinase family protein [Candidatus Aminicenantes bacterium]|nr:insulinase family protein [Candidatus Aminicenantes bacterium]
MRKRKNFLFGIFFLGLSFFLFSCAKVDPNTLSSELLLLEGNPLVSFRILLKVGSAHDPAGKEGLCQLAFTMLASGGSQSLTFKEISKKLYPMAARVGLRVDKEMSVFTGQVHTDNLEKYYAILKDMLLNPGFREDDFKRIKTNHLNFLQKTLVGSNDEQFGKEILNLLMYEGHPYGHHEAGTVEALESITLDEIKAFYKEHFLQGNITIGLAGGYPADFPDKVREDFSAVPEGLTAPLALLEQRSSEGLEIVIADKKTPATAFSMGFPVPISRADEDFFALWIAGSHFGEHRQSVSHLFQKIREERGQNYGDYAYIEHFIQGRRKFPATNYCRQQQYFSIWIRPLANSNRHFVLRQTLRELKKLVEEGISRERFELVRTYLLNYTKLYTQTLGERLGWQMDSHYYGYQDFLEEVQRRLPKIKHEDVNRAIKKYLNFNNIYIAIITEDAEALKEAMVANTPSPITYANPNMPQEILEEDLVIQSFPLDIKPEKVKIATNTEFFQKTGLPQID